MAAPHHAEIVAELAHPDRAVHRPEMRVRQRDVHAVERDAVAHLAPVGVDHVGGGGHTARLLEFGHDFTSGEPVLRTAGVLAVGKHFFQRRGQLQSVLRP